MAPPLSPGLSPELELGVDDDVGVEETFLAIGLDCAVEEDGDDGNKDVEEDGVVSGADVDVDVEVEAKSTNFSGAGA